jgi:hypothetical protein
MTIRDAGASIRIVLIDSRHETEPAVSPSGGSIRPASVDTLGLMRSEDVERYRGRWVAVRRSDDVVLADAESLEALQEALTESEHPQVLIRRIPALDDPIFVGLA